MKLFLFMSLFIAAQVSSAPTENGPKIFVLSSDGLKEITSSEVPEIFPIRKTEDKPAQAAQIEGKVIQQSPPNTVELVPSQVIVTEQPTIKVNDVPAVKVEEIKQVEKEIANPEQKIEVSSKENTNENSKKDETSIESSIEVKSNKNVGTENRNAPKIIENSSFLNQIYNSLFGHLNHESAPSSSSVVEISMETSNQPKIIEIAPQADADVDDIDIEVTLETDDGYQSRREEIKQLSMLQQFLRMLNLSNSIPSIFGQSTPTRSFRSPSRKPSIFDFSGSSYEHESKPHIFFA